MLADIILKLFSIGCGHGSIPLHICSDQERVILSLSSCNDSLSCISPVLTSLVNSIEPFQDVYDHHTEISYANINITDVIISGLDRVKIVLEEGSGEGEVKGAVTAPIIVARGMYQVDGYVFNFIPIYGNGSFTIELSEVSVSLSASSSLDQSVVNFTKIGLDAENVNVFLENLLGNNYPRLANLINSQLSSYFLSYSPVIEQWIISYLNNINKDSAPQFSSTSDPSSTSRSDKSSILNSTSVDSLENSDEKEQLSRRVMMDKVTSFGEGGRKYDNTTEIIEVLDNQDGEHESLAS